jgi:hypothetical protein
MKFTPLERDVIGWIVRHCDDEALVQQLMSAKPRKREFTGVGSFTGLLVPAGMPEARQRVYYDRELPLVVSPDLEHGAGTVLFCKDGVADVLEFYTFASDPFPQVLRSWELKPLAMTRLPRQEPRPPARGEPGE